MNTMQLFSNDLGLDLGTANVLIYAKDQGVVVREPAIVALDKNTGKVIQVGAAARNMLGRTPGNVVAMRPMQEGVISDQEMAVKMIEYHLRRATSGASIFTQKPRVIVSVPSGITEVQERTVINTVIEAGARRVYLIEEPLAAALGAGLDLNGPNGHMVVDIGAGTTDIAVLSMNGVSSSSSIPVAGDAFDEAIARHIRRTFGVIIGQATAEDIKIQIGCVISRDENAGMQVKGRDIRNGMPKEIIIHASDVQEALQRPARAIVEEVAALLEETTPELAGDIAGNGITLTGGCSQIYGMDRLIQERTGIQCSVADDPESCVAYGCGRSLAWMNTMNEGPINLARKRLLKG